VALLACAASGCSGEGSPDATPPHPPTPSATAATGHGIKVVARVRVEGQPCGVAGVGGAVWVSDAEGGRLLRIDRATGGVRMVARLDPSPCEIAIGFGSLWVVTQSGRVDRVDPATGHVVARIRVGATSYEAVATSDAMWVSNRNDGTIQRIDPHSNRVVKTVRVDGNPGGLVSTGNAIWVGDDTSGSTRLFRLDPTTGRVTRVRAGNRPGYVASAGGSVWVSNVDDGTVTQINPSSGRTVRTIPVGLSPVNLVGTTGAAPEVWVPDDAGNAVVRLDARTGRVAGRLPAEGGPAVAAQVGPDVWVSLFEGSAVLRLQAA
jgi:streptogramin lyase